MKTTLEKFAAALGVVLIGTILTTKADAQCGYYPPSYKGGALSLPQSGMGRELQFGLALFVSEESTTRSSSMWKFTFTAQGNTGPGAPPDRCTPRYRFHPVAQRWDGNHKLRTPSAGWQYLFGSMGKNWKIRCRFNHFATATIPPTRRAGLGTRPDPPTSSGDVMVSRDGKHYAGTFTLDAYDTSNALLAHIVGVVTATRITVHTPASSIF